MKLFKPSREVKPGLTREQALSCVPSVVPSVQHRVRESGLVYIEYPFTVKPLLKAIFDRFGNKRGENLTKKLELDQMGSQVWTLINAERTVKEIIIRFASDSGFTRQEAEQSVTAFLRELGKRGLIVLR